MGGKGGDWGMGIGVALMDRCRSIWGFTLFNLKPTIKQ